MKRDALELLLRNIEPPRGRAWHGGVTVVGALRNVTAREARRVPRGGRHGIWSLALHLAYWKYAVRRLLQGEPRGTFALEGSDFWTRPESERSPDEGDADWRADLALLANRLSEPLANLAQAITTPKRRGPRL